MSNETKYGRYVIRSMQQRKSSDWAARAFRGETTLGNVHRGATEQAAIIAVKKELDELDANQSREHALRGPEGYPTAEEVAFCALASPQITNDLNECPWMLQFVAENGLCISAANF